jgi:tetratricopeptide (TPR) repeat protein
MQKTMRLGEKYLIYLVVFLVPLVVARFGPNPYALPKLTVAFFGLGLILILKSVRALLNKKIVFTTGHLDLAVFLFLAAYLLGGFLVTPNKMEAFFFPGVATIFILAGLFYFLINQLKASEKRNLMVVIFASGIVVSLVSLFATLGLWAKIPQLPSFLKSTALTPLEGSLGTAMFLGALLPLGMGLILSQKEVLKQILLTVCLIILLLGLGIAIYQNFPGKPTQTILPDFQTSWVVAIDTLKESPILGIGPGNYLTAFSRFRPLAYNSQEKLWTLRFAQARNFYLTTITETGLLGLTAIGVLALFLYKAAKRLLLNRSVSQLGIFTSLIILLVLLAIFPPTPTLIFLLFILLALLKKSQASREITQGKVLIIPTLVLIAFFFYKAGTFLAAEAIFEKSLDAFYKQDGQKTYDLMRKAVAKNPRVDRYHASFAQINLALAQGIASSQTQGVELSEQDRNTISQLIQQAIAEGKAVVALNPQRAGNWELLAEIYKAIMPFAQGGDTFAIQSYSQAIALDPINPSLRIRLGGIYYAQGNYDSAIDIFKVAVLAKNDLPNSHYNLAVAYRDKGETDKAIEEMKIVLTLVPQDSSDYEFAKSELQALESKKPVSPLPTPEPQLEPALELPEEATPPAATTP